MSYNDNQPRDEDGKWSGGGAHEGEARGELTPAQQFHERMKGLRLPGNRTYVPAEPPKAQLATYTDEDGYKVHIRGGIPHGETQVVMGVPRMGTMVIESPSGEMVRSGYWMGWPEKEWGISNSQWDQLPWTERAKLEAKQQATAYKPLREQFKFNRDRPDR